MAMTKKRMEFIRVNVAHVNKEKNDVILSDRSGNQLHVHVGLLDVIKGTSGKSKPGLITIDLFISSHKAFGNEVIRAMITEHISNPDCSDIYAAQLVFKKSNGHTLSINCSSMDAMAFAVAVEVPIFCNAELLKPDEKVMDINLSTLGASFRVAVEKVNEPD